MSWKIKPTFATQVLHTSYSGVIDIDVLQDSAQGKISYNNGTSLKAAKVMLDDFTLASEFNLSTPDIKRDIGFTKEMAALNPDMTLIVIVPGPLEYGLSRMWQTYSNFNNPEPLPWQTILVRSKDEADSRINEILNSI